MRERNEDILGKLCERRVAFKGERGSIMALSSCRRTWSRLSALCWLLSSVQHQFSQRATARLWIFLLRGSMAECKEIYWDGPQFLFRIAGGRHSALLPPSGKCDVSDMEHQDSLLVQFQNNGVSGDFTKAATLWPNGTWTDPLSGPS